MKLSSRPPRIPLIPSDSLNHRHNAYARAACRALMFTLLVHGTVTRAQSFEVLYAFPGGADGWYPFGGLVPHADGSLYGGALGGKNCQPPGCGMLYRLDAKDKETVLYTFRDAEAAGPANLLSSGCGDVYGTIASGGRYGAGDVFEFTSSDQLRILHSFAKLNNPNSLARDALGNLYGTTGTGGAYGWGSVFKLDRSGRERALYSFSGGADGGLPGWPVVEKDGDVYGLTADGGKADCYGAGCGVIFEVDKRGQESVLYAFTGENGDGKYPSSLLPDSNGDVYGATAEGGSSNCEGGCGTLFKLTPGANGGWKETVLYTFTGGTDGAVPEAVMFRDSEGNLYGTTGGSISGCSGSDCGTIFKLAPTGELTTLYTFTGGTDGAAPFLWFRDESGTFYGTAVAGGDLSCTENYYYGCGTVFKLQP